MQTLDTYVKLYVFFRKVLPFEGIYDVNSIIADVSIESGSCTDYSLELRFGHLLVSWKIVWIATVFFFVLICQRLSHVYTHDTVRKILGFIKQFKRLSYFWSFLIYRL